MKKPITTLILGLLATTVAFGQEWSDAWEFNDEAGTPINVAANSGTSGMLQFDQRNPDDGPPTGGATDGAGLFVVTGDTSQSFRAANITGYGGVLSAEWVITGWDLDSKDVNQSQSFRSAGIRFRDQDLSSNVLHIQLNQQGTGNVRMRYQWDNDNATWTVFADALDLVSSTTYVIGATLDTATGAFSVTLNGAEVGSGTTTGHPGVNRFNLYSQGQYQAAPYDQDFVNYDSLKFNATVIPEPTWAGYTIGVDGWVDTTPWLGWVNVSGGDWIYMLGFSKYVYLPESIVTESGSWGYVPGQ
jgi:hypothetical protein